MIQPQSFLSSEEEDFLSVSTICMDMAAILFNFAEPFEQIGNTLLTESPM